LSTAADAPSLSADLAGPSAGLLVGFMLLAAILGGTVARAVRVPKVVGYLLSGVVLRLVLAAGYARAHGAEIAGQMLHRAFEPLMALKILALGMIVFAISQLLEVEHLRAVGRRILRVSIAEAAGVVVCTGVVCAVIGYFTGGGIAAIGAGVLLGIVAVETAPSATLITLQEYDAKGPVTDTVLTLTAINCTVCIVLFHVAYLLLASTGVIAPTSMGERWVWLDLAMTTLGSAVLGSALGFLFSVLYAKVTLPEFLLVFLAVMIGLGTGAGALAESLHLSFNFLLTTLFMGAVFTNVTLNSGPAFDLLKTISAPLYAIFFVMAGFDLHIADVGSLGLLGGAYVAMRVAGKYIGIRLGVRWAHWTDEVGPHVGLGMLCQAGVAIGLTDFLLNAWRSEAAADAGPHPLALQFKSVVLGAVVLYELVGPIILKRIVMRSGEVKAITLLRRPGPAVEGESVLRQTWGAFVRAFKQRAPAAPMPGDLQVRHIMRSNVKFLKAGANFDDVLHFVEASKHNHFPVVDDHGAFAGMIHFGDLREMMYDPYMRDLVTAVDLAAPDDMVPADLPLAELMAEFNRRDVGALVVVQSREDRRVVGLVEQRDLLRALRHGGAH